MLSELMRPGDRVVFKRGADYYANDGDPAEDGAQGVVRQKIRITNYQERFGLVVREPGVYELDGPAIVEWDNGLVSQPNGYKLEMVDTDEYERRRKEYHARVKEVGWVAADAEYDNRVRIGDLPTSKAWEQDFIKIVTTRHGIEYGVIAGIDYYHRDEPGKVTYRFDITDENKNITGGQTYAREDEIEVLERGNVYKHYNGEPVTFKDLQEEAAFYACLGHSTDVRSPVSGNYGWTMKDALQAIKDDLVDSISLQGVPFGMGIKNVRCSRFKDRDLGKRLQAETLKGFEGADIQALDDMREKANAEIRDYSRG